MAANYDVSKYTTEELMKIIEVDELDIDEITKRTDELINKYEDNLGLSNFFLDVQEKLIQEAENSLVERKDDGTSGTFQVPVKKDNLNPNLKNTIQRFINLDSQFRLNSSMNASDYTLDLSDMLKDVLSLRLYSYQIPNTWYAVDTNTCFWIVDGSTVTAISVTRGNYSPTELVDALNAAFTNNGFTFPSDPVVYNANSGKITLRLSGGQFSDGTIITETTNIVFYDYDLTLQCGQGTQCSKSTYYMNNTIGWLMGYREAQTTVLAGGNEASAVLNLNGPKYLILVLEDYNQNHVNNGLVSISQPQQTFKLPSYYSTDMPYVCEQGADGIKTTQVILPTMPRLLTRPQIYTINEINRNRAANTNLMAKAPTSANILTIIPIKNSGVSTGKLLVDFSGSLQEGVRTYFGPVNIERMAVKLLDDRGLPLNLNGGDWCVTLICECLYQY
jgi:hypothetical protein